MTKALNTFVVAMMLLCSDCKRHEPEKTTEKEFLQRHRETPLTPEGIATIIDDRNKREGKEDNTDYAQAYASSVADGVTRLLVLEALDRGDIVMAKKMLITTMNVSAGFLPVYGARAQIASEQEEEAVKFSKGYLDYLVAHTNEIEVGRLDFTGCFIGLGHVLQNSPDDLNRLTNLIQSLNWPRARKAAAEPGGTANGSQPIRRETNQPSSAAGSRR